MEAFSRKDDHMLVSRFIGIEVQGDLWILFDVRDFICFCLTKDQKGVIFPDKPDRSGLRRQI